MKHRVKTENDNIIKASQSKKGKIHIIQWKTNFGYESACGNYTPTTANPIGVDELQDFEDICTSCQRTNYFQKHVDK